MAIRVLSVSSSRADVSGLTPVWAALAARADIKLSIALSGMHCADTVGRERAMKAAPEGVSLVELGSDLGGDQPILASQAMAGSQVAFAKHFADNAYDVVLLFGDRLDMLPAAIASLPFNLALAHIHGGELTFGAIDDRVRHALSKLSHLHFVSGVDAANRLAAMGEEPSRIHVTGAPGLDALASVEIVPRDVFLADLGFDSASQALRLVTVHPETNSADPLLPCRATLQALDLEPGPTLLTEANSDMGGAQINELLRSFVATRSWAHLQGTLGLRLYASAMTHASVMVGNSSSGIVEAGLFGLPVVNVGERQTGRAMGQNVLSVPPDAVEIVRVLRAANGKRYDPRQVSLYGDTRAAPRIAQAIADIASISELRQKRHHEAATHHFSAPWASGVISAAARPALAAEASGYLVTRRSIVTALRDIGIRSGDIVMVHTKLSSLGFVAGSSRAVVEALIETVGDTGTLVMPAFSGDLSDPADWKYPPVPPEWVETIRKDMPAYSAVLTPTRRMGAVAELFRQWPGTLRSSHPQSSFAARGPDAAAILEPHDLSFRFGGTSPLARLESRDAWVIGLGSPWNTFSIFYLTETSTETHMRRYPILGDGPASVWADAHDLSYTNAWFPGFVASAVEKGIARTFSIGQAQCVGFRARAMLEAARKYRAGEKTT